MKIDELAELLKDEKMTDLLVERLERSESFNPAIEDMLDKKLDKKIDKILFKLDPIIDKKVKLILQDKLSEVQENQSQLRDENAQLRNRVTQLETELRLANLVLHGLEETSDTTCSREAPENEALKATLHLCHQTMGLNIHLEQLSLAHKLPRKGQEKHRPIVVKFNLLSVRNTIYRARTQLCKTPIFINEHLSSENAHI